MTISGVLGAMTTVYDVIIGMFSNVITTITGNPLIFVPVAGSVAVGLLHALRR